MIQPTRRFIFVIVLGAVLTVVSTLAASLFGHYFTSAFFYQLHVSEGFDVFVEEYWTPFSTRRIQTGADYARQRNPGIEIKHRTNSWGHFGNPDPPPYGLQLEEAFGFPLRSAWMARFAPIHGGWQGGIGIPGLPGPAMGLGGEVGLTLPARAIPYRMIWGGLFVNFLAWCAMGSGGVAAIRLFRGTQRQNSARCPVCKYLRGGKSICPECGCDLARWKTWRYLLFGEIPLAPGPTARC